MVQNKKLLDIVVEKIRVRHYSMKTEKSYTYWIKDYILFHNKKHPKDMGKYQIEMYLTHLAIKKNVSPTTQNQAFSALLFLYEHVLHISLKDKNIQALRAKTKKRVPVVLTIEEVKTILHNLNGIYKLIVKLMYPKGISSF
jgi:site-specific recombinase XerD